MVFALHKYKFTSCFGLEKHLLHDSGRSREAKWERCLRPNLRANKRSTTRKPSSNAENTRANHTPECANFAVCYGGITMRHMLVALALSICAPVSCIAANVEDDNEWWQELKISDENPVDLRNTSHGVDLRLPVQSNNAATKLGAPQSDGKPVDSIKIAALPVLHADNSSESADFHSEVRPSKCNSLLSTGAKVNLEEAEWLALHEIAGKATGIELERSTDGKLTYVVFIQPENDKRNRVDIDATTGAVLRLSVEPRHKRRDPAL
jgi:hypothetical protein